MQTAFCILISYPKMQPTDQTSIGLLYPFSRRMTSGARYHLVVTLRVSLARGLCKDSTLFTLEAWEIPDSPPCSLTYTFLVFDLTSPFFFALPYSAGFYFSAFSRLAFGLAFVYYTSSSFSSSLSLSSSGALISSMILASPKSQILTTSP